MKTIPQIVKQLQENAHLPIIGMNVSGFENKPTSVQELIKSLNCGLENIYRIDFSLEKREFITSQYKTTATKQVISQYANGINITLRVEFLNDNEVGYPLGLVRLARNLKALKNSNYEYSDDNSVWKYWNDLKSKLDAKIAKLSQEETATLNTLI